MPQRFRRSKNQRLHDEHRISQLMVRRIPIRRIAEIISEEGGYDPPLKHPTIQKTINKLRADWRANQAINVDAIRSQQLAELDEMEADAWAEWERSKGDRHSETKEVKGTPGGKGKGKGEPDDAQPGQIVPIEAKTKNTKTGRLGDPRYFDIILRCQKRRAEILGTDAPSRTSIIGPDGKPLGGAGGGAVVFLPDNGRVPPEVKRTGSTKQG